MKGTKLLELRRFQRDIECDEGHSYSAAIPVESLAGTTKNDHADGRDLPLRHHVAAIDGLRALAIIGVVGYHMRPGLIKGGFIGVTLFFVISGFLVTASVERRLSGPVGFRYISYLASKLIRLAVPLLALEALLLPALWAFAPSSLPKLHLDCLPASLFAINWVYIFRHLPYFQTAGLPSPLTHLWFLAVIMQFYVIWPLLLWLMHRCRLRLNTKVAMTLTIAVGSTFLMMLLSRFGTDVTRAYYGLDTRAAELMIGALAAFYVESRSDDKDRRIAGQSRGRRFELPNIHEVPVSRNIARLNETGGHIVVRSIGPFILLGALLISFALANGSDRLLYVGGYQLMAVITASLVVLTIDQKEPCALLLGSKPLRYLGSRSFSLYLVHYPLLQIMNPAIRTTPLRPWEWIVQVLALWIVAELFYQLAEAVRSVDCAKPGILGRIRICSKVLAVLGLMATMIVTFLPVDWNALAQSRFDAVRHDYLAVERIVDRPGAMHDDLTATTVRRKRVPKPTLDLPPRLFPKAAKVPKNLDTTGWTYDVYGDVSNADPLIISDSVEMGAQAEVQQTFPHAVQDNLVGRPFSAGLGLYRQYQAQGHGRRVAIIALGTNGPIADEDQVEQIINAADGQPLYFTTVRAPVDWQDANNDILRKIAAKHSNVGLLDWYRVSEGHPEYFYADGTHLTPGEGGGRAAYAMMIRRALCGQ